MLKCQTALTATFAAGLALLGPSAFAQTPPAPMAAPTSPALSPTDQLFMLRSAQGDMAEIMTSQMALKKTKNSDVQQVAQKLISDHGKSLQEGMGLATLLGVTPPKDPGLMNMAFSKQLSGAGGKDFNKMYMAGQVEAHENTIALYTVELTQGQNAQVKAFAAKYLPGIEGHTAMIYQVAQSVGAPDMALRPATPPTVSPSLTAGMDSGTMPGAAGMGTPDAGTAATGAGATGTATP